MVSRPVLLQRFPLGRWWFGLWLLLAPAFGWACAGHAAEAGQALGPSTERRAAMHAAVVVAKPTAVPGAAAHVGGTADRPCDHGQAAVAAESTATPCVAPGSPCAGACATACSVPGGAPALPCAPAGLPAAGLTEGRPTLPGWADTGRCVPPESPPPIV